MNSNERIGAVFVKSLVNGDYYFRTVAMLDIDDNDFVIKNGEFEKCTSKLFNNIKGDDSFIYGNLNEIKIDGDISNFAIHVFDNDFIMKIAEEKNLDLFTSIVYLVQKMSKIKLEKKKDCFVSVKNNYDMVNYSTEEIYENLYGDLLEDNVSDDAALEENEEIEKTNLDELFNSIANRIVGQDKTIKTLLFNILYNQILIDELCEKDDFDVTELDSRKISILLDGPSGTGKTAIMNDIGLKTRIPMILVNAIRFAENGYTAVTINDILQKLLVLSEGDLDLAERSIVVFEGIDKIINNSNMYSYYISSFVQDEILSLMDGQIYDVNIENGGVITKIPFDTSKLTFIVSGNFSSLKNNNSNVDARKIGFVNDEVDRLTIKDYIKGGMKSKFFEKIKVFVNTNDYDVQGLKNILLNSELSPLKNLVKAINIFGYDKIILDDNFIDSVSNIAYDMGIGARGLQLIISEVQNELLLRISNCEYNPDEEIVLDSEWLNNPKIKKIKK